jgi:hypothetical protein
MTTKSKARKAPAKAARKTRAKPAPSINKIEVLITRWKWCEADQDYKTALAPPERDADRRHYAEQETIIAKLRTLVPQNYSELEMLFRFALDEIKGDAVRQDRASLDMLTNAYGEILHILCAERETARQEGMRNMREFLDKRAATSSGLASDPEIMQRIGHGYSGYA